jgi:transcriptional regulator with XRE-family HTH domain
MKWLSLQWPVKSLFEQIEASKQEVAARLDVSLPTVSAYLKRGDQIKLGTLSRICRAAGYRLRLSIVPLSSERKQK